MGHLRHLPGWRSRTQRPPRRQARLPVPDAARRREAEGRGVPVRRARDDERALLVAGWEEGCLRE